MAACQDVRKWMTKNVLMPVTQFITEARETCNNVQQWIEEQVQQPVDQWISQQEERCRNWPWPLNWLCRPRSQSPRQWMPSHSFQPRPGTSYSMSVARLA